jgi:hypothetical protein
VVGPQKISGTADDTKGEGRFEFIQQGAEFASDEVLDV